MKYLIRTRFIQLASTLSVGFSLCGFASCSVPMSEVCTVRFPEFDRNVESAISALGPWRKNEMGRGLASVEGSNAARDLAKQDRDTWKLWAEERLSEAQHSIDLADGFPGVRNELSDIANQLVTFHGYTQNGRVENMVHALEAVQLHSQRAREQVCPTETIVKN
jgi:hypothetical protein